MLFQYFYIFRFIFQYYVVCIKLAYHCFLDLRGLFADKEINPINDAGPFHDVDSSIIRIDENGQPSVAFDSEEMYWTNAELNNDPQKGIK